MTTRFATNDEIARWDELLTANPDGGNVFQSSAMIEAKRANGWSPRYLMVGDVAVTVLEKHVAFLGNYWYLPKGPGVREVTTLLEMLPEIQQIARQSGVFTAKIEPEILEDAADIARLREAGLIRTRAVQPNVSTVLIDLSPSLEDVLASFNQKGRHALHRAERDGVTTKPVELSDENMRTMFDLLKETASGRFESSIRSFAYYRTFWQNFAKGGRGQLFFAYYEGNVVAGAYCMYLGEKGLYKDGASTRQKAVYGASHLLQWEVMQWMKARGVTSYDLCGAPHSSEIKDEYNPFYGIGRFKTSFNKHVTDYIGAYDLPVRPLAYKLWQNLGQRLAVSLSWRLHQSQWL